ncbi:MAG: ATP-binding cassette domain-containing protein [Thermodesulfobacteriota bacterium]
MKEQHSPSPCSESGQGGLCLTALSFLGNGPYDLEVGPGQCVGLSGRSGVGKSQLLRAVADVMVHRGECFLDGRPASSFSPPDWRKKVAMVPAESFWWHDTVGSHFSDGILSTGGEELFARLGFSADVLSWQISRLSTGERQRLSLLRTLVSEPHVLLLDEPTSALDTKMATVVEEIVMDICALKNTPCLWVSHDLEQLSRVADRVFRVEPETLVSMEI